MHEIFHLLVAEPTLSFFQLFKDAKSKLEIIVIFLALLELIRMKEIRAKQDKAFTDIVIIRNEEKAHLRHLPGEQNGGAKNTTAK
jgi:segregation and condensation protein A